MRSRLALAALVTIAVALAGIFSAAIWDAGERSALGDVHFQISCSVTSQALFNSATARLHSLRYIEAERAYASIAGAEPDCTMAYWGIAMSRLKRPAAGGPAVDDIGPAKEALRRASATSTASPRERDYFGAVDLLFREDGPPQWNDRMLNYERAMGEIAERYPDDREATIFYALALNMAALPTDKTYRRQTKAAELLLVAFAEQPRHPGLSHYLLYCLNLPAGATPDLSKVQGLQLISRVQSAFAALALAGVVAFFAAVLPVWSRLRTRDYSQHELGS